MEIFDKEPKDWIDLQDKVAYILAKCGYRVETPKKIETPRSNIEVDVFAQNSDLQILCECKNWNKKISQNTIFSFRTIVSDIGANKGIIIAKKGFQSGAYKGAQYTNIELKTWEEFMLCYKERYVENCIKEHLKIHSRLFRVVDDKYEYWECYDLLNKKQRQEVDGLKNRLMKIILQMTPLCSMVQFNEVEWNLGYTDAIIKKTEEKFLKKFNSYSDFFEFVDDEIKEILPQIELLYQKKIL